MSENTTHRRRNLIGTGCGCLLVLAACLALVVFAIWNPFGWFQKTETTSAPAPTAIATIYSENPAIEPLQPKDWADGTAYPEIFKGKLNGVFYCGAKAASASYPAGFEKIETWSKVEGDGNYLHASASNSYSMAAFCAGDSPEKHFAPAGTKWVTALLEVDGLKEVGFPLQ